MVQAGLSRLRPTEVISTHERKFRNMKQSCVKITSVCLKVNRQQVQH